jgi:two-component system response regulator CpxR
MSVVAVFSASYSHGEEAAREAAARLDYEVLPHEKLLADAAERFGVEAALLERALWGERSVFNRLTRHRERGIARIRVALAERVARDRLVLIGPAGHLLPTELTHVLRVGLAANFDYRVALAAEADGVPAPAAQKLLRKDDEQWQRLTLRLFGLQRWDPRLYDVLLPMHSTPMSEAVDLICENAVKDAVKTTAASDQAARDFVLAAQVQLTLADSGHDVEVRADEGRVTLVINRAALRLEHLRQQLVKLAKEVPGVTDAETKLGPHYKQPEIYPGLDDSDLPPKILLVDDEKEFVLTLSERLETRNLESAVAHDGEEALAIMETDAPDVMVLDLKMPGIDGLEVLERVKQERPQTQVIILTGHGSDKEEVRARELGAFAYLQKPVDIDVLAETMKQAYRRARQSGDSGETVGDGGE